MQFLRKYIFLLIISLIVLALFAWIVKKQVFKNDGEVKVGVLFSKTGTMANSEQPVINAVLLAIEEINTRGGIKGQKIIPVAYDAASNWKRYGTLAETMIKKDKVDIIFACWTSASRKKVKEVVEKYNNLLIYSTQYEGIEQSPNIIYLGTTPNQQIIPAIAWTVNNYGKKVFLVGSNYIFPHVANEIITHEVKNLGGNIVGEAYIPLGSNNVDHAINDILKSQPDIIFNTINGDSNIAFFTRLNTLASDIKRPVVMSFSLSPEDINKIGAGKITGDLAAWSYFITQNLPENSDFLKAYQNKYGSTKNINDPAVTAYAGVYLWAQAANEAPSLTPNVIYNFMLRQSVASPAGVIYIDPYNAHAWRTVMLGKINNKGLFDIVWSSYNPIEPIVYPEFNTRAEWELFEYKLYLAEVD
ncbi:MAG: hypothetical protein ACD_44C00206G0005 [uncultured bacterium]|nr:MAG: hypothetical protein ACD_44C00206G0005 [uncultured bacterium]